jgi:YVTN family beta-propeller protein
MKNHFTQFVVIALASVAVSLNPCFESAWADNAGKSPLTGTVIVVNQASDTVTLVDVATMEAYKHVPVTGGPHEAAVSPDGRQVIVTN